ncbi:hypothetical protein VTO42DRAFT_4246 [Malbranchea cinnamomea]
MDVVSSSLSVAEFAGYARKASPSAANRDGEPNRSETIRRTGEQHRRQHRADRQPDRQTDRDRTRLDGRSLRECPVLASWPSLPPPSALGSQTRRRGRAAHQRHLRLPLSSAAQPESPPAARVVICRASRPPVPAGVTVTLTGVE